MTTLNGQQIAQFQLTGWTYLAYPAGGLMTRVRTGDFATGLSLVNAIGERAEAANHHPDIDFRYDHLDIRLISHDEKGVTQRDVDLARQITEAAAPLPLDPAVTKVEWGLDTPNGGRISPFWAAILGLPDQGSQDLVDESGSLPSLWYQPSGSDEPRQRWHPDVWVDAAQAKDRLRAALAVGGTMVSDKEAPSFWVLADHDGNQACICTWQDRAALG